MRVCIGQSWQNGLSVKIDYLAITRYFNGLTDPSHLSLTHKNTAGIRALGISRDNVSIG